MMAPATERPARKAPVGDPTAMFSATNIDRRSCHRVVPMEVLAFGVSRTGTSSMRQALIDLGYSECYHFGAILNENPRDCEMWNEAIEAKFGGKGKLFTREDWDQLLGHCMAITDTPCAMFYKELFAAYPDAKVILTVRDSAEQWWQSQMRTVVPWFDRLVLPPQTLTMWLYRQFMPPPDAFSHFNVLLQKHYAMYNIMCNDLRNGTRHGIRWYEEYCAEIQRIVPRDQLLVMNVREGWAPLCNFLGKDVPPWDFPKVNSTKEWYENVPQLYANIDKMVYWNMAKTLGPVVVGAIAVGAYAFINSR